MARDIEEFLRKAAERRRQQQAEKQAGQPPAAPQPRPQPRPRPVQPQQRRPKIRPAPIEVVEVVEVVPDSAPRGRGQAVETNVKSNIDTSKISAHAEGLGHRFDNTSEDADERMRKKFDRDISTFDSKPYQQGNTDADIVGGVSAPLAQDLVEMLRNPKSICQAILLSEILTRPNFDD